VCPLLQTNKQKQVHEKARLNKQTNNIAGVKKSLISAQFRMCPKYNRKGFEVVTTQGQEKPDTQSAVINIEEVNDLKNFKLLNQNILQSFQFSFRATFNAKTVSKQKSQVHQITGFTKKSSAWITK
jgi:hypothetical protein